MYPLFKTLTKLMLSLLELTNVNRVVAVWLIKQVITIYVAMPCFIKCKFFSWVNPNFHAASLTYM